MHITFSLVLIGCGISIGAQAAPAPVDGNGKDIAQAPTAQLPSTAVLRGGNTQVAFREWSVKTDGAFPHDPLATADGAIWYTGQRASVLGRIDPKTGTIKEYP